MSEISSSIKVLIFILMAIGLIFGLVSKARIGKYILGLVFIPIVLGVIWTIFKGAYSGMSALQSMLFATIILVVGLVVVLRILLGKELWSTVVGNFIYDVIKWLFLLPFRMIKWILEHIRRRRPF